jgi:hypothetical protein
LGFGVKPQLLDCREFNPIEHSSESRQMNEILVAAGLIIAWPGFVPPSIRSTSQDVDTRLAPIPVEELGVTPG